MSEIATMSTGARMAVLADAHEQLSCRRLAAPRQS